MKHIGKEKEKEKLKVFSLIFHYLRNDKLKLVSYLILVITSYIPSLLTAFFWGYAIERLLQNDFNTFAICTILYVGINIIFYSILSIPRDLLYNYLELKFSRNVQKDLYRKMSDLPAVAFEEIGVGEYINRLISDAERVMELLARLIRMICKALVVVVVLIIAFKTHLILGLEILFFALIMGFISCKFFPKIKKVQENIKKDSDNLVKNATENLTGIREIKALGIKQSIESKLFKNIDSLTVNQKKINRHEVFYFNSNNLAFFSLQLLILITAGYLLSQGKMTFAIFTVISNYIWRIDEVVSSVSEFGVSYSKVKVSLKRIDEIINNKLYQDEQFGTLNINKPKGIIDFKNVTFRYSEKENNTLNKLNLTVEPNQKVAIIGRSGNGKSTIFNLLLRYFDPTEGMITLDGYPLTDLTEKSLRNNISIIRQSPFLFNLSILDNFKVVKRNATLKEIRQVCKKAYIDEYIMSLPKQYQTIIGEGGVNLSGGQKQRIAIARTLLINTKIILFDEATSALDNESQEYIKKTIDELSNDHTVIIIAHRLSTIIDADIIHVINKGQIVDSGTHQELLANSKTYQSLYTIESTN